jgi:hypothetical protein
MVSGRTVFEGHPSGIGGVDGVQALLLALAVGAGDAERICMALGGSAPEAFRSLKRLTSLDAAREDVGILAEVGSAQRQKKPSRGARSKRPKQ